ncbi:hypothetical protein FOMA001_g19868 [Fusarium oxysporum f. sp. matthiolae]|nr:hypothetical protein FOMA001_g19868 [Fusarium oxysporum f. sp. matthiolae]
MAEIIDTLSEGIVSSTSSQTHPRPSAHSDATAEIRGLLDEEVSWFDDNVTQLLAPQLEALSAINNIMQAAREDRLPKQRLAERRRIRSLMADVLLILGQEMFLLCAMALPVSKLLSIKHKLLFKILQEWWRSSPRPRGLTTTAVRFCGPIQEQVSLGRKRKFEELGVNETLDNYETPYCTIVRAVHLQSFLQQNCDKYQALTLRVNEDIQQLPYIEISMEMCQNLLVYAMQKQHRESQSGTESGRGTGTMNITDGLP